jgi:hypothetical protein
MAFNGKPTRPVVEELLRSFNPEPGSSVERLLVEGIIRKIEPRASASRMWTCMGAWRAELRRLNKLATKPAGDRIYFLSAEQALRDSFGQLDKGRRAAERLDDYVDECVDPLALKEETDKAARVLLKRSTAASKDALRAAVKETKAPLSVSGNPRLKLVSGDKT